jgi:hypothetical protein
MAVIDEEVLAVVMVGALQQDRRLPGLWGGGE